MDDPSRIALIGILILAVVAGVALPLHTLWRVGSPDRRRDAQLAANAQPRLTAISHAFAALLGAGAASGSALGAIAGYPFLWGPACLGVGLFASTIISAVAVFRAPPELD